MNFSPLENLSNVSNNWSIALFAPTISATVTAIPAATAPPVANALPAPAVVAVPAAALPLAVAVPAAAVEVPNVGNNLPPTFPIVLNKLVTPVSLLLELFL